MSAPVREPEAVAVLDVGKTNVKLVVVDPRTGDEVWGRAMPNRVRHDGPYPHADTAAIADFLLDGLADLAKEAGHGVDALSITTHGATGALIGGDGLALPVLDYEHDGPDATSDGYNRIRPAFAETFSPGLPGGLNLGAQLFWQARTFPEAFARASAFVTYPQYWASWLTGVAATEATSLGCHTDLWAPEHNDFSPLVDRAGWRDLMAPRRSAFDVLGAVRPEIARRIGLRHALPVLCGLHDSNASLLPHLDGGGEPRSVVSTGTWVIAFALGGSLDRLDPHRDTLANVDAYGRPVPSARFMGGREFDLLTGGAAVVPDPATIAAVIGGGLMALPSFAPGSGPFPQGIGRWTRDPASLSPDERSTVAGLYAALMTATCLSLIGGRGITVIEGPFARNALFCDAVAALTGRPAAASRGGTGTSTGAALLARPRRAASIGGQPSSAPPTTLGPAFDAYAARWRGMAGAPAS